MSWQSTSISHAGTHTPAPELLDEVAPELLELLDEVAPELVELLDEAVLGAPDEVESLEEIPPLPPEVPPA